MASYWSKRRRVIRTVRDMEKDILKEYEETLYNNKSKDPCVNREPPFRISHVSQLDTPPASHVHMENDHTDGSVAGDDEVESDHVQMENDHTDGSVAGDGEVESDHVQMENDHTDGSVAGNVESDFDSDSHDEHQPSQDLLMRSLRYWATSYSISLVALSALLSILKLFHPMLPKDGRTLLRTQHDCGSYLAELDQSMDHCNDGLPTYNSSPYHTMPLEKARNDGGASYAHGSRLADFSSPGLAHLTPHHPSHPPSAPETPRKRLYGGESSRVLKDIAAMRTTKMLTELCMEVKQISRDIQFIKMEFAKLNIHGAGPESQEDYFPIMLPLTNEEKFDETEAALREEAVRRKMITRLALVGGTNSENMIRRMLSAAMTNSLACIFNSVGKGEKRAFKDTLMQDCMFVAARQFDRRLTELTYRDGVQKWLRYAPERNGGVPRKK